jgi:hypothetical protein
MWFPSGLNGLHIPDAIFTEKYISVLDDNLWPVIARHFSNQRWIFQEDNAPGHVSIRTNQWKEENDIHTLPWPAQSPFDI